MRGPYSCFMASLPKVMITGPIILNPAVSTGGAPARMHSSSKMNWRTGDQPVPPQCLGQLAPDQPCRLRIFVH
ncbi:hypothetical protein D3C76_1785380 [compost metagenome]